MNPMALMVLLSRLRSGGWGGGPSYGGGGGYLPFGGGFSPFGFRGGYGYGGNDNESNDMSGMPYGQRFNGYGGYGYGGGNNGFAQMLRYMAPDWHAQYMQKYNQQPQAQPSSTGDAAATTTGTAQAQPSAPVASNSGQSNAMPFNGSARRSRLMALQA